MFFQRPWAVVEEGNDLDPAWSRARAALGPPSCFELVSAREDPGPCISKEVGNQDDECARDRDERWFELG